MWDFFPSDREIVIMLAVFGAVCIGAWELLSWLVSLIDFSVSVTW